jgi:sulfite reductase (ferredoxin)
VDDVREFTIGDLGVGECAGEVVSLFGIEVVKAESQAFDAQVALEEGDYEEAEELAYKAMLSAARALVRTEYIDVTESADDIVKEWRVRFFDTERFFDKYAGGRAGQYLLDRYADKAPRVGRSEAARRVEEAQLFIEAAHACEARSSAARAPVGGPVEIAAPSPAEA